MRVKVAWQDETRKTVQNVHPEFEDVAALARDRAISWLDIHRAAWIAWEQARQAGGRSLKFCKSIIKVLRVKKVLQVKS